MCGRFAITLPDDAMARLFAAAPANDLPAVPNFNVCPTDPVHVVRGGDARALVAMRWGFVPQWYGAPNDGPLLINARAETIAEKPAFRDACRKRRCLLPTSGFYEWVKDGDGNRLPYFITRRDGAPLVMGGVWQDWEQGGARHATCAVVTLAASADVAHIHHRMPLVLEPDDWAKWLGEEGKGAAGLMQSAPVGTLQSWRVGMVVNSNRATGAGLIAPLQQGLHKPV